jgi:mono/diheme cytochrome c family protein
MKAKNSNRNQIAAFILIIIALVLFAGIILLSTNKTTPPPATLGNIEQQGKALFMAACNDCHSGEGRQSSLFSPSLSSSKLDDNTTRKAIVEGKGSMPGFSSFSKEELDQLVAYLKAIRNVTS